MNRARAVKSLLLGLPIFLTLGCDLAQIEQLGNRGGNIFGDNQQDQIVGEVLSVNTRQREIELRTDDRRSKFVRYDNQTRVVYRDRDYSVANLEPGDYVAAQVQTDRSGSSYTDLVRVRESVQDRGGGNPRGGRAERLQGTVEYVDSRRGEFEIRDESGRRVMVTLPYNPNNADTDRLQSLRRGDHVRVEGRFLNPDRFELESFV